MSRDIVNQMTDEMGMNQQMLQNMQHQQMAGAPMDFTQMSPEQQQMMMMQQASMGQRAPPPQQAPPMHDYDDSSSMTSSSLGSVEMDLNKLGLNVSHNKSFFDNILQYLKDPLIIVAMFVLISTLQFDSVLKPLLPYGFVYGLYYSAIKAVLGGIMFVLVKLAI